MHRHRYIQNNQRHISDPLYVVRIEISHIQQNQLALHRLASSAETHVDVRVVGAQLFDQRWYYNVQKTSKPGRERRKCCRGDEGTVVSASTVGGYGASRKGSYRNDCFTLPSRARIRGKCRMLQWSSRDERSTDRLSEKTTVAWCARPGEYVQHSTEL